jgi:protein-disulfide isomerase
VSRNQLLVGLVSVAAIAMAVAAYFMFFSTGSTDTVISDAGSRFGVTVTARDRTQGSPKAPILMLEYGAPSCPHCAHFDMDLFPQLKQQYIDTGKVFYVFRAFPLGPQDVAAESIARCLPEDNYFQFIDLLFRNQAKWDPEFGVTDVHAGLVEVGRIAGLGQAQVDACIANQAEAEKISQVGQEGATKYSVSGVPSFIVNGQMHGPFENWQELKSFLDPMLSKK